MALCTLGYAYTICWGGCFRHLVTEHSKNLRMQPAQILWLKDKIQYFKYDQFLLQ